MIVDALPENAKILRVLGPTEELVLRFQKQADFCATANNIACHIQLGGACALTLEILRQALDSVTARHPLLQANIAPAPGGMLRRWACGHYVFVATDSPTPIPIQVLENVDWALVMQQSLQEAWTLDGGPLLRVYLITSGKDNSRQDLVLWLSHILVDGLSLFSLMAELLTSASALVAGRAVASVAPLHLLRDIWAYSPSRTIHWGQVLKRLSHYITTPFSPHVFHPPTDVRIARTAFKTQYLQQCWSKQDSAAIVSKAQALQTSVGGLIGAALILAVAESAPQPSSIIGLSTIVDLRRRAKPPVPFDSMGHCASQIQTYYKVTPETSLEELAREVQRKVKHVLESGIVWDVGRLIRLIAPVLLRFLRHGPIVFPHSVILSNVGRLQVPPRIGLYNILQCHAIADFSFGESYIFLAFATYLNQAQGAYSLVKQTSTPQI